MSEYDFSSLNDKEFEVLAADLLSSHFGVHVERFKPGKDAGVDGRFFGPSGGEVVVQCKHWLKSGLPSLLKSIERSELEKVVKLNPSRYIFVTSLELSRANKITIKKLFSPYILSDSDIFGGEDLNDLLAKYPEVEKKHYKLWITSTTVLQMLLNSAIVGRSKFKLEEIIEDSSRYVITASHEEALKKIEDKHSIIITGAPGVGKTSLADQLCQYYVANKFEMLFIENSLNEAEASYDESRKQVFYFDDFLGRNFLLALDQHQDSQVVNFICRVARDAKKRFILTSRSNVLNQGKQLSDLFGIKKIDRNEYELSITSLTEYDKARILYSHIWFGQLDNGYIDEIYKEARYKLIIKHDNFNPRLISFITDSHRLENVCHSEYWSYIQRTLDNPQHVWKNVFDVQIDTVSRHFVIAVCLHGSDISEDKLKEFYSRLMLSNLGVEPGITFDSVVRVLVGALLNRSIVSDDRVDYDLFNPSIADYVIATYLDDIGYIEKLLCCLQTENSVDNIRSLHSSGVLDQSVCARLVSRQITYASAQYLPDVNTEYLLKLLVFSSELLTPDNDVLIIFKKVYDSIMISGNSSPSFYVFEFLNWLMVLGVIDSSDPLMAAYLQSLDLEDICDYDDFNSLSKIVSIIDPESNSLLAAGVKQSYIEFISDNITRDAIESGVLEGEYNSDTCDVTEIVEFVEKLISDVSIDFDDSDLESIAECCDVDDIVQYNMETGMHDDQPYESARDDGFSFSSESDAIDDLFDRG